MTRRLCITLEPRAEKEIETIEKWWAANRSAAPTLFLDELARAYSLIREQPLFGQPARSSRLEGVRRVLLRRSRYYLYYKVMEDRQAVVILSVWHASRGHVQSV